MATGNDLQALAEQRQAIDNINRLAKNGAPNKALQAAYNELLEAVRKGNEKAIEKAVEVAVNEKSRYVAERITRTEMARAWADGFIAKMKTDADIVSVKFKLSSRHPVFDICDMYAKADMYGLGAGIYPKDKLPPTDEFVESIAKNYDMTYTKCKKCEDNFTLMLELLFIRPITALLARKKKQPCLKE